jgi:hypothetical protein
MDKTELVKELYKPFDLDEHEIRIGSTKKKAQWFVYVRREAITARLDRLFPLDWSSEIINVKQHTGFATAIMRLTISGISRENNGSNSGNSENAEKGAVTDAFKRVASTFGLGLYLQSTPKFWTAGGFVTKDNSGKWHTDYKEQNRQEKEAFAKFAAWHRSWYGDSGKSPQVKSNGQNGSKPALPSARKDPNPQLREQPEPEQKAVEWNEADRAALVNALASRFPTTHIQHVFTGLGVKSFEQLGTLAEAGNKILDWAYDDCKPFVADVVKYAVDGKQKFLVFRADAEADSRHIAVRAYGRSSTIKNEWLGEYAYNQLGFDTIDQTPNQWIPLRYSVVVHYDAKLKDSGEVYYVATGLGHKIAEQAVNPEDVKF